MKFNLLTAHQYAQEGRISDWIDIYLRTGEWMNLGLADGLHLAPRYWLGPVYVPMAMLERVCGPEPHMEYRQPKAGWEKRVGHIVDTFISLEDVPPLIVMFDEGRYTIRDGNHRYEAIHRLKYGDVWVFIWSNTPQDAAIVRNQLSAGNLE